MGVLMNDKPSLEAAARSVLSEGSGVVEVVILMPEDWPGLVAAIAARRADALLVGGIVKDTLERISRARQSGAPMLCSSCSRTLEHGGFALAAIIPAQNERTTRGPRPTDLPNSNPDPNTTGANRQPSPSINLDDFTILIMPTNSRPAPGQTVAPSPDPTERGNQEPSIKDSDSEEYYLR